MLELIPTGGLCNKMRAIDSAVNFSRTYNVPLKIYWEKDERLINCRYEDLFNALEGIEVDEIDRLPFIYSRNSYRNLYLPSLLRSTPLVRKSFLNRTKVKELKTQGADFKELYDKFNQHLVLKTFSAFFPPKQQFQVFEPLSLITQRVQEETRDFDKFTIGIHIRRSDHKLAIKSSPLHLFEQKIQEEILKDARSNFYLASDCSDTKKYLLDKYGDIIRTNTQAGDRTTLDGMIQGITELYSLAQTAKIYCSFGSSYSGTASLLGCIERIQLRNP